MMSHVGSPILPQHVGCLVEVDQAHSCPNRMGVVGTTTPVPGDAQWPSTRNLCTKSFLHLGVHGKTGEFQTAR